MRDPVGSLNGEVALERALDQSSAKLFRVCGVAGVLESPFLDYSGTEIRCSNPVPVESEDGRHIGYANISLENNCIIADLAIDYATPERLTLEINSQPLYLHLHGVLDVDDRVDHDAPLDLYGHKQQVDVLEIFAILISEKKNHYQRSLGSAL